MERTLNELELVICNGRRCVSEPEWSVMIIIEGVWYVCTDNGMSDHFLVFGKQMRTIRQWRLDKIGDALQAEAEAFSEGRNEGE